MTFRGTYDILLICLTTLFNVWNAVHMDIPIDGPDQKWYWSLLDKVLWMLAGVFMLEWLLFVAVWH